MRPTFPDSQRHVRRLKLKGRKSVSYRSPSHWDTLPETVVAVAFIKSAVFTDWHNAIPIFLCMCVISIIDLSSSRCQKACMPTSHKSNLRKLSLWERIRICASIDTMSICCGSWKAECVSHENILFLFWGLGWMTGPVLVIFLGSVAPHLVIVISAQL